MRNNTCVYWTKIDEVWQRIMKYIIKKEHIEKYIEEKIGKLDIQIVVKN